MRQLQLLELDTVLREEQAAREKEKNLHLSAMMESFEEFDDIMDARFSPIEIIFA